MPVVPGDFFERVKLEADPIAATDAMVTSGEARFTLLSDRLVRLEYAAGGAFEDRGTLAFPHRRAAAPAFCVRRSDGWVVMDTGPLHIRYREGSGEFTSANLSITFVVDGGRGHWRPGQDDSRNLGGTTRTLDGIWNEISIEPGLLSRDGWHLHDDTRSVLLGKDGWVCPRDGTARQDWYFFGHGLDYKAALADYSRFGGRVPMLPRFALGAWWSRYWAYSDADLRKIVTDFRKHGFGLDVLVIDMDWHTEDDWTGYTWNRKLFPDPEGFLRWVHEQGLKATLNLHPAKGVQAFEEVYDKFARHMGVDPATKQPVPFRITDRRFVEAYFRLLHHRLEEQGVDFWWMDWQQGTSSEMEGLDPLCWINHLHFMDSRRRGQRPFLFSRWGGLGGHRYQIGFSGDTRVRWASLAYLPWFTATAANVLYGWWSHDIGGHLELGDAEIYARWVQFGVVSPILRLHSTKNPDAERRPWKYGRDVKRVCAAAWELRAQLVPYLYTLSRVAHDSGVSPCYPMYYDWPNYDSAYVAKFQYRLGDQLIAAPIVHKADETTGAAAQDCWIPPGQWIDWQTHRTYTGPRWVRLCGKLDRLPLLAREGAIVPLGGHDGRTVANQDSSRLSVAIFAGRRGEFRLYEDDGDTLDYADGAGCWTPMSMDNRDGKRMTVTVGPCEGECCGLGDERDVELHLVGIRRPEIVKVNGEAIVGGRYDSRRRTLAVSIPRVNRSAKTQVVVESSRPLSVLGESRNRRVALAEAAAILGEYEGDPLDAALNLPPQRAADAIAVLGGPMIVVTPNVQHRPARQSFGSVALYAPADGPDCHVSLEWTLEDHPVRTIRQEVALLRGDVVRACPFAWDGTARPIWWRVRASFAWGDKTWTVERQVGPLCPSISRWRYAVAEDASIAPPVEAAALADLDHQLHWHDSLCTQQAMPSLLDGMPLVFDPKHADVVKSARRVFVASCIVSPSAMSGLRLKGGGAGEIRWWLNGKALEQGDGSAACDLRAGRNLLIGEVSNIEPKKLRRTLASAAVLDSAGEVVTGLQFEA